MWKRHHNRIFAEKRVCLSLKIIIDAIKDYRYCNPIFYQRDGVELIAYEPNKLKRDISINLSKEMDDILQFIEMLKHKHRNSVWLSIKK